jgi:hypothetical protein
VGVHHRNRRVAARQDRAAGFAGGIPVRYLH